MCIHIVLSCGYPIRRGKKLVLNFESLDADTVCSSILDKSGSFDVVSYRPAFIRREKKVKERRKGVDTIVHGKGCT